MKFEDAPRLPKLPFILGNIALLGLAWFIYARHPNPFSPLPLFIIFVCFVLGILTSLYPYVINNLRDQADSGVSLRHELDEQFKRLVSASEHLQNSILQLKSVGEASAKAIEAAGQLPARMQEKIADFGRQIESTENKDKVRLEQEVARLRSAEAERQTAVANQIASALAEWTAAEADARRSLAEVIQQEKDTFKEQIVTLRTNDNERQAAAAAQIANALAEWTRIEADARRSLADMVQQEKSLFQQQVAALRVKESDRLSAAAEEITMTLASWTGVEAGVKRQLVTAVGHQEKLGEILAALDSRIANLQAALASASKAAESLPSAPSAPDVSSASSPPTDEAPLMAASAPAEFPAASASSPAWEAHESVSAFETRAGSAQSEQTAAQESAEPSAATDGFMPAPSLEAIPQAETPPAADHASEVASAPPFPETTVIDSPAAGPAAFASASSHFVSSDPASTTGPLKLRAPRKPRPDPPAQSDIEAAPVAAPESAAESSGKHTAPFELIAEPVSDEPAPPEDFSQVPPEENKSAANASLDGRTRLTVVSYIGIGNKLHIRGEGAGLNWSKGIPLQFVSIGRWRWETDKATEPVACRIYKNDKLEAPVGALTLLPGTEQEISVSF